MENETVDTVNTVETDNVETNAQETPTAEATQTEQTNPFATGKEKFKVNGVEEEWDWNTTKRYASLGKAGYKAMEKAAEIEKKAKETYLKLQQAAQSDPEGLIAILTGNTGYKRQAAEAQAPAQNAEGQSASVADIERKIYERISSEYAPLKEKLEALEVEKERQAISVELDAAVKEFPELDNPIHRDLVKQYYRRAIMNGTDIGLADVAFHVSQQLKDVDAKRQQKVAERIEENKRRAPVSVKSSGHESKKAMTIEDVRRIAGRI